MSLLAYQDDATDEAVMSLEEAKSITAKIRGGFQDARDGVLQIHRSKGWRSMGYECFQAWAQGEFKDLSWQQVYNLKSAAEIDEELALHSPTGEIISIPVNHAKQLRKLKKPESRVKAHQKAVTMAKAQGKDEPSEKIIEEAVSILQAEETVEESPYPVVRQMLAEASLTAPQAKQIALELNELKDDAAQAYVQKLMANYGLVNPELVFPLGYKFLNERQRGKVSKVLDELEASNGRLAGTPLSRATSHDLKRANAEAQAQHIAESEEQKRMKLLAEGQELAVEFALTLWKNAPVKSAKRLIKELPPKDLEDVFNLLAKHLGYVTDETNANVPEHPDAFALGAEIVLYRLNGIEQVKDGDRLQVLLRVKPEEEKDKVNG